MAALPPFPNPPTFKALKGGAAGGRHDSAALCSDDRIVYVWLDSGSIFQCHYPTVNDFVLANNDAATAGTDITSHLGAGSSPKTTVWRHPSTGELYLLLCALYADHGLSEVFRSPSGNGESAPGVPDWVEYGTIQHKPGRGVFGEGTRMLGTPHVTPTGRWVVTAANLSSWQGVFTSDDEGVSWTLRQSIAFYSFGGGYGYGQARNVLEYDGALWWSASGNVEPAKGGRSLDGGTTWPVVPGVDTNDLRGASFKWPGTTNSDLAQPVAADANGMYVVFSGAFYHVPGPPGLELTADPPFTPRSERLSVVPHFPGGYWGVNQRIGDHDCYMVSGQLMTLPTTGWSVDQVRIA